MHMYECSVGTQDANETRKGRGLCRVSFHIPQVHGSHLLAFAKEAVCVRQSEREGARESERWKIEARAQQGSSALNWNEIFALPCSRLIYCVSQPVMDLRRLIGLFISYLSISRILSLFSWLPATPSLLLASKWPQMQRWQPLNRLRLRNMGMTKLAEPWNSKNKSFMEHFQLTTWRWGETQTDREVQRERERESERDRRSLEGETSIAYVLHASCWWKWH